MAARSGCPDSAIDAFEWRIDISEPALAYSRH